jgi:hypothetical protein
MKLRILLAVLMLGSVLALGDYTSTCAQTEGCSNNRCGAQGGFTFPDGWGAASFLPCCNQHDCCWGNCNFLRWQCDENLGICGSNACASTYGWAVGLPAPNIYLGCVTMSRQYAAAVASPFARGNFLASRSHCPPEQNEWAADLPFGLRPRDVINFICIAVTGTICGQAPLPPDFNFPVFDEPCAPGNDFC